MLHVAAIALLSLNASAAWDGRLGQAVEKLRRGDPAAPGELVKLGAAAARAVEPLLGDPNLDARRGAVAVLAALPDAESCRALGAALADESEEIRSRAALAVYQQCPRGGAPCDTLLAGIGKGDASAAAVLLSGYCGEAARKWLETLPAGRMKLEAYGPVVPASLVASVARLRLGDSSQAGALAAAAGKSLEETEFILQVLPVIPREHLSSVLAVLDDRREAKALAGVPKGVRPRRVCDAAVDAFASRLGMKLPFERRPAGRYTAQQMQSAKAAIRQALLSRAASFRAAPR